MKDTESRRVAQNFVLVSELLIHNASHIQQDSSIEQGVVKYCASIGSKKSAYLLKYFPYQCLKCQRYSNEILIVQCGNVPASAINGDTDRVSTINQENSDSGDQEVFSCNSAICLECAVGDYEAIQENDQPVDQCIMCGHSLIINKLKAAEEERTKLAGNSIKVDLKFTKQSAQQQSQILPIPEGDNPMAVGSLALESNFSNIEELDAENDESSVENSHSKKKCTSPDMKFSEVDQTDRSLKATEENTHIMSSELILHNQLSGDIILENIIIRDATAQEKEELKILAEESVQNND